ncbi:MAG: hypothetical protein LBC59_00410 [Chitinispirillales bacterium]|jgi:hypothetical protein|nr:hypothetical protein [Chitinispirillales bacterium]
MNKASKVGARSKPTKKLSKPLPAAKPAKKRSKPLSAAKTVGGLSKRKIDFVPLAEVEVAAAAALKKIKATKKLSPEEKELRLANVAESLEKARTRWGGLSHAGMYLIRNAHVPSGWCDLEAVLA